MISVASTLRFFARLGHLHQRQRPAPAAAAAPRCKATRMSTPRSSASRRRTRRAGGLGGGSGNCARPAGTPPAPFGSKRCRIICAQDPLASGPRQVELHPALAAIGARPPAGQGMGVVFQRGQTACWPGPAPPATSAPGSPATAAAAASASSPGFRRRERCSRWKISRFKAF